MSFLDNAKKNNEKQDGFTLIELIVVMAIFMLLFGVVVGVDRAGQRARALDGSAQVVTGSIREAMNMSLGGRELDGSTPSAYGVYLEEGADEVVIIALFDNGDTITQSHVARFREDITIESVSCNNDCYIVFWPPYPRVSFYNTSNIDIVGSDYNEATVEVATLTGETATININSLGVTEIVAD